MTSPLHQNSLPHQLYSPTESDSHSPRSAENAHSEPLRSLGYRQTSSHDDPVTAVALNVFSATPSATAAATAAAGTTSPQLLVHSSTSHATAAAGGTVSLTPPSLTRFPSFEACVKLFTEPSPIPSLEPFRLKGEEQLNKVRSEQGKFQTTCGGLLDQIRARISSLLKKGVKKARSCSCTCEEISLPRILPSNLPKILAKYQNTVILDLKVREEDLETLEGIRNSYTDETIRSHLSSIITALKSLLTEYDKFKAVTTDFIGQLPRIREEVRQMGGVIDQMTRIIEEGVPIDQSLAEGVPMNQPIPEGIPVDR